MRLKDGPHRQSKGALPQYPLAGSTRIRGRDLRCDPALQPRKKFRQNVPEGLHRGQCRQLVAQHMLPACYELIFERIEIGGLRDRDAPEVTLLAEYV